MEFALSEEQEALRAAARDLLDSAASRDKVRAAVDAPDGYDVALWKEVVDQGWLGLEVGEEAGGLGLGFVEVAVLCEEVGRHVAPAPFLSTALAIAVLARSSAPEADEWLHRLVDGGVACVGWGDGPVIDAPAADIAIIAAAGDVWAVPLDGDRPEREAAMDATRTIGWLRVDDRPRFGLGGPDLAVILLDRGASAYAAELLGAADWALATATAYAKVREQFGRPIGSFQAVKHRLADMLVDVEGMRSAAYYAAWAVDTGSGDRSLAASTAKAWCSDAARRVMASALQVHGGIGFTWDHDLHLYLKRAHTDETTFGSAPFHRERIAGLLRERIESGADLF